MPSLGELFISLGFDVDDQKLKNFQRNLRDTHEEMVKLGTVAATTVGALSLFIQNAADGAVRLNNMALMFGANTQAAQTFANALHQVNSQISITAGQAMFGQFSQLILGKIPLGQGAAGALALLGGGYEPGTGQTPEQILENLAHHYGQMKKQLGIGYGVQLEQIGLGGAEPAIKELAENPNAYYGASKYNTSAANIEKLTEFAKATAELDEIWNKFFNDLAGNIAPQAAAAVHTLVDALNYADKFANEHPTVAAVGTVAGVGASAYGGWKILQRLLGGSATAAGAGSLLGDFGYLGALGSAPWVGSWLGEEIGAMINNSSSSSNLSPGILRRLKEESGLNPNIYGKGKEGRGMPNEAYGIGQWHPDRQALFAKAFGHDIHGSSLEEQEKFINWELLHGDPGARLAERLMRQTNDENEKYKMFTKYYERPAGSQNIVINVHSNATDNQEVAHIVSQHLQDATNRASAQTNLQGY